MLLRRRPTYRAYLGLLVAFLIILAVASTASAQRLLLFGGSNHDVFLGCFSCNEFASDSIFNEFGAYGSEFRQDSIFNDFGTYGSSFSQFSPCNRIASNPPVLVDENGGFYGYLTLNRSKANAIRDPDVLRWLETAVCGR
jgi:hypothetical protein